MTIRGKNNDNYYNDDAQKMSQDERAGTVIELLCSYYLSSTNNMRKFIGIGGGLIHCLRLYGNAGVAS